MGNHGRPRFYFSFRSPYSWIGSRLLQKHLADGCELEYIPYWEPDQETSNLLKELGGDFLYVPMSRQKHLYILQDVKRSASRLGYPLAWPIDRDPWWDLPHLAYLVAVRDGKGAEFRQTVERARWELGLDITDPDTVANLAAEVGVDPARAIRAPNEPEVRHEGARMLYRAYCDGVFGVPFFINGFHKFWGVDRLNDFLQSLRSEGGGSA